MGVGLGVAALVVGACVLLGFWLLGRCRRGSRGGAGQGAVVVEEEGDGKMAAGSGNGGGAGVVSELHGAEVKGCRGELEGSGAEGREELA